MQHWHASARAERQAAAAADSKRLDLLAAAFAALRAAVAARVREDAHARGAAVRVHRGMTQRVLRVRAKLHPSQHPSPHLAPVTKACRLRPGADHKLSDIAVVSPRDRRLGVLL